MSRFLSSFFRSAVSSKTSTFATFFLKILAPNLELQLANHYKMPELLNLPNEILVLILEEVDPEDLEQVALSCKTVYRLMKRTLIKHADMKRKYSHVIVSKFFIPIIVGNTPRSPLHPASLLRDVLLNNRISFYPQHLAIGQSTDRLRLGERQVLPQREFDKEIFGNIHDILLKRLHECPYLNDHEAQVWGEFIGQGCQDAMLAFLITLFPNLRSMRIYPNEFSGVSKSKFFVHDMVLAIANGFSDSEHPPRSHALSKLFNVYMHSVGLDLGDLFPFAALPSVRSISGRDLSCLHLNEAIGLDMSALQSIKLLATGVKCHDLAKFLGETTRLKRFIFQNEIAKFQPRKILSALLERAASTLTQLVLINGVGSIVRNKMADYYFGTLSGFQSLKLVFVDEKIFFEPVSCIIEGENDAYIPSIAKNYKVQPIIDMLPASVQDCWLSGEPAIDDDFAALMEGLLELRIDQFQQTHHLVMKAGLPGLEDNRISNKDEIIHFRKFIRIDEREVIAQPYW